MNMLPYWPITIKKSAKPKSCGIFSQSVFLDVFRPPDHNSGVHLPLRSLAWVLANLFVMLSGTIPCKEEMP